MHNCFPVFKRKEQAGMFQLALYMFVIKRISEGDSPYQLMLAL